MRKLFFATILIASPLFLSSQNISVKSFRLLDNDLDALVNHPEIDRSNGEKAALIKIVTTETGFEFGGGQLGIVKVVQKTAEIWVYVPAKLKAITIAHPKLGQVPNRFYNFEIPIVSGKVYEMVLVTGTVETIVKPVDIETQWFILNTEPSEADIYINDQPAGKTPYQNELPVGKYSWRVSKELYLTDAGVVELTTSAGKSIINLKLKPNYGSIVVKTTPEVNAKVFVNGMDINKTTPCNLERIPTGDLTISAKGDFYSISPQTVKMTPGQNLEVLLVSNPTFGTISVSTTPESGAAVTLNGMPTGKTTPCTLERVPAGDHTINLSREWYETTTRKVTLDAGQVMHLKVELNPIFSEVSIATEPIADIYINGQLKANGTWKGRLNPGVYTFEGKLDKHNTAIEKQTVIVGTPLTLTLKPTPKTGTLKLVSNPFDAIITLNGKEYGTTPSTIKNLLIGDYTLILKKTGYGTITKTVTVKENAITEVNEVLPSGMEVSITSTPSGAQLSIDGVSTSSTPFTATLGFGNHTIKLVNGKKVVEETIAITQNGKIRFDYNVAEFGGFTEIANSLNLEMLPVQGGTFQMGSNQSDDEKPIHSVTLSNYYIGKYEVTQAQWRAVMNRNPSSFSGCDNCPVEQVSWNDIQDFIKKLNAKTGKTYRLPTEAEWEYAARGGSPTTYSGSNSIDDVAWYNENSGSKTHPVGGKKPNKLGIYDMTGNVWEWCSDWYDASYYASSPSSNPQGASSGTRRVLRGGSWNAYAGSCRVAYRGGSDPDARRNNIGFRLVCVP